MLCKRIIKLAAVQGLLLMTAACSTTQQNDEISCDSPNWQQQGVADASAGVQPNIIQDYQSKCSEQFTPDAINAYKLGFFQGLQAFCSYDNGYKLGFEKNIHEHSCPMEQAEQFKQGQKDGYREYLTSTGQENSLTRVSRDFESVQRQNTFDQNMGAGDGNWTSTWEAPSTGGR